MSEATGLQLPAHVLRRVPRADEVDRLWQVCTPVLDDLPRVQPYEQGSWGPQAALDLLRGGWRLGR